MKFSEDYAFGTNVIRSFTDGLIEVNNKTYTESLIIGNNLLITDWAITHIDQLTHTHWLELLKGSPEVIIMGTGSKLVFPPPASYAPAIKQGVGVEFMDSAAACRTYNILASEDRSIIAGIIL